MERAFAAAGHYVFSNASNFRTDPLVPLLVPDVNAQHLDLVRAQHRTRWSGGLVTTPGWSTVLLVVVLAALREFEIKRVTLTVLARWDRRKCLGEWKEIRSKRIPCRSARRSQPDKPIPVKRSSSR